MADQHINLQTGEILDPLIHAPCGRRWGERLWEGGPILGGQNWREFAQQQADRKRAAFDHGRPA